MAKRKQRFEALKQFTVELKSQLTIPPRPPESVAISSHHRSAIQELLDTSVAENTRKAFPHHWRQFTGWCQLQHYNPLPAGPVASYLAETEAPPDGDLGASVSTIGIALIAVRYIHSRGVPDAPNLTDSPLVKSVNGGHTAQIARSQAGAVYS